MSNVLARVLILINLRGVKLRVGLGRGVRYYKELRIRVRVGVGVGVRVRARVRVKVMMGRTSLIPTRPTLTMKLYPPLLTVILFLCFFEMGPEHVPLSCVGQVVLTIVVFLRYGPRTRPAILSRGGCSYKRQLLCFF